MLKSIIQKLIAIREEVKLKEEFKTARINHLPKKYLPGFIEFKRQSLLHIKIIVM